MHNYEDIRSLRASSDTRLARIFFRWACKPFLVDSGKLPAERNKTKGNSLHLELHSEHVFCLTSGTMIIHISTAVINSYIWIYPGCPKTTPAGTDFHIRDAKLVPRYLAPAALAHQHLRRQLPGRAPQGISFMKAQLHLLNDSKLHNRGDSNPEIHANMHWTSTEMKQVNK